MAVLVLPFNSRTQDELCYFMQKYNISFTDEEKKSVTERERISDEDYNKLFGDHVVFLDLYSSTCNNVIMECITANCPIIVNRIPPVEKYLGKHYPLYYDRLDQVNGILNSGNSKVLEAYYYLKQMDKERFMIENIAKDITVSMSTIL